MPHDLRADTSLTRDPGRPNRFHANLPDAWKVVYVFGGVSMYAALRAMQEALDRPDLDLVTANAIFLAPVPPGRISIDVDILRDGRRASQVAADLRVDGVDGPALRVHGVFGTAHDTDLAHQEVRFPEVSLPADTPLPPDPERPNPFGRINFHEQTAWRPVSPLDDQPGKVYDGRREGSSTKAWGFKPRPGTAQVYVFPDAKDGRVIADVVRLDKGHTEGLEPNITDAIVKLMVSAAGGKLQKIS